MNFADRMKQAKALPKNETITITLDEYAKAGTEAMARILGDALQFGLSDEMVATMLIPTFRLAAVAIRDELFGGAEDD